MEINTPQVAKVKPTFGQTIQVRLVSDLQKSLLYYRDVLGCEIDDWGHATRDEMVVILQQAQSPEDVRPNAVSKQRDNYPTEWTGPNYGWDTFIHVKWDDLEAIVDELSQKGAIMMIDPEIEAHGNWEFKNVFIQDPDRYQIVLGAMRERLS